jgi:hypothetical protein
MRPALFYISEALLRSGPSAREAEALRQARLAEIRLPHRRHRRAALRRAGLLCP